MISVTDASGLGSGARWNLNELPLISGDTSSLEAINTIRQWLYSCQNEHEHCKSRMQPTTFPKRILRLTDGHVQLCEHLESQPQYACLSHCWGPIGPTFQLNHDTVMTLKTGVPRQQLPKTFRDAVTICLNLGIHYLWIDSLCR